MTTLEIARRALPLFALEAPATAEFVPGGLTHRLLRAQTADASYALKLWSPRTTMSAAGRAQLERAETLASLAARANIPALSATRGANGQFLQYVESGDNAARAHNERSGAHNERSDAHNERSGAHNERSGAAQTQSGQWVSLYRWIDGQTLPPAAASPARCAQMGAHLGALHALQMRFPGQDEPAPEAFERGHFGAILARAQHQNAPFADALARALDAIEAANDVAMRAQCELRKNWVTGHLDFDQKNVLWHEDNPTILDWENAKPIHPALEAMGAALSWAGQSAGAPNQASFAAFLGGYRQNNALDRAALDTAVDGVLGKWILWLEFNLQRLLEPQIVGTPEAQIAHGAALHALGATLQLREDGAMYRDWIG